MNNLVVEIDRYMPTVDWVTATRKTRGGTGEDVKFTDSLFPYLRLLPVEDSAERWSFMGYHGWKQGKACWGSNHERALVRAWGEASDMAWRKCVRYADTVSRLDLAVTFWPKNRGDDLAELCAEIALEGREEGLIRKDKKIALVKGFGSGDTVYFGSRKSQVFARLYDKSAQTGGKVGRGVWRAEVELKDDKALATGRMLAESERPLHAIAGLVSSVFAGSLVKFDYGDSLQLALPNTWVQRDERIERILAWLSRDVRPAVVRAVRRVGQEEVMAVLGLDKGND